MVVVPSPLKIDLEKDNDLIDFIFFGSLYSLRIRFWTTTTTVLKNWNLATFWWLLPIHCRHVSLCTRHLHGESVRRAGLTLGIWSACGREREGRGGHEENGWQWINPTKELIYQFHQDLTLPQLNSVPTRSCWLFSEGIHVSLLVSNMSTEKDPPKKCNDVTWWS